MPSAERSILFDIIMYVIYLWIAVTVISFFISVLRGRSCCGGPANAYEHFQDAGTINSSLYKSLIDMTATLDQYTQNLQSKIDEMGTMKSQTCSLYDSVRNKYIKSKAAEVPDSAEFQLPKKQQELLERNRAKNAESTWQNQIELYKFRHKESAMIDCTQVNVRESSDAAAEGFQDAVAPATIDGAVQTLLGKANIYSNLLDSPAVQQWLNDCKGIKGTANFLNMYINNVQIQAMIDKCKGDYIKAVPDFKNKSDGDKEKYNKSAELTCNIKFGNKLENFDNPPYVNTEFAYPVPFPTASMSQSQKDAYKILSVGQAVVNKLSKIVGNTYQDAIAAYKRMNAANATYVTYKKQVDTISNKNYSQSAAGDFSGEEVKKVSVKVTK